VTALIAREVIEGTYGRRQLESQATSFWTNHFNTDWAKVADYFQMIVFPDCALQPGNPACDSTFPAKANREATLAHEYEIDGFRDLAFNGNFREIVERSALSPAMVIFLDTVANLGTAPNENYARELLELYALGVDGGYTQQDVEELARVFTGWTVCKRATADLNNPTAPCIGNYWLPTPAGAFVTSFNSSRHDCTSKVLFDGTAYETTIPSTCSNPNLGVQDVDLALDAIAAHPSTARFISKKLLQRFVSDTPDPAWIDALVDVWNDAGNPQGVGDLREVLRAALTLEAFDDPSMFGSKVKTPAEHLVSALRTIRGRTDGVSQIFNTLVRAQHLPYLNPVPTGWSELAPEWIGTNGVLERQNFGVRLAQANGTNFGSDPVALLGAHGVSTAPGNAAGIVDFFADALFGGALTPAERQRAIDFLNTNNAGAPAPYDSVRIRQTVGLLLGLGQFFEQ
jgi:uncharacterized protein (DUF1800 family)